MIRDFALWPSVGLGLLLFFAPMPFGSVGVLESRLLFAALGVLGMAVWWVQGGEPAWRCAVLPAAAALVVTVLGGLQSLRLLDAASADGVSLALGSVAPEVSRAVALQWFAAALALLLAAQIGARRRARRVLFSGLVAAGLFQVAYGTRRWAGSGDLIWGTSVPGDPSRMRGTFVNPDHLAFLLGLILPLVLAWGWWSLRQARRGASDRLLRSLAPAVLVWLALWTALALTGSRAGALIGLVTTSGQLLLIAWMRRSRRAGLAIAAGSAAVGLGAAMWLLRGTRAADRLAETSLYEVRWSQRLEAYRATLDLWQQHPLFGVGLGAFRQTFPTVQSERLQGEWWHAHSDVLELLATTGLVGSLAFAVLALLGVERIRWGLRAQRSEDRAAALGILGACAAALMHSAVDFGLTMPANTVVLAVLVGCGCAVTYRPSATPVAEGLQVARPGVK